MKHERLARSERAPAGGGRRRAVTPLSGDSLPLYKKVKMEIVRTLSSAQFDPSVALPTEEDWAGRYDISVGTVRRAMAELVAEKVLVRQQGRGTFLVPHSSERMGNVFWHVARPDGSREAPIVQNLSFVRTRADAALARVLKLDVGDGVHHIANLMFMSGRPVVLDDLRIPEARFPGLTRAEFVARETSIYGFYQSRFKVYVLKSVDHVRAARADARTARLLETAPGTPLLDVRRLTYTFNDVPIESRRWLLRTDDFGYLNVTGGTGAA